MKKEKTMTDFHYDLDADGIATIRWDVPDKSMNVLSMAGIGELEALIDKVIADEAVKGAIITSAKKDFAGGMDLNVIAQMKAEAGDNPAKGLFEGMMDFHRMSRKIERAGMDPKTGRGGKPVVAALPGTTLGIGYEIALACHRIIAADNSKAKIGLPEIMVGLFPGGGGTTRLSRKMDLMTVAPFLLEGKLSEPQAAAKFGLIDEVVASNELLARAKDWILNATDADLVKPWDKNGFKMPGGEPYTAAGYMTYVGAVTMVHGKTQGVYPAARAMLSAIYEGAMLPFDEAIRVEARWFTNLLLNPSSSAMINTLFISKQALEKGASRPAGVPDMTVRKLGVLGAGMMGAGIAFVSARSGIEVVLLDRDQASADRGKSTVEGILDDGIKRRKITEDQKAEVLGRVHATASYDDLKGCDLIVEAVFEDPEIKADATRKAEAQLDKSAIFATNTSTLPVTELAKASRDDSRYIGIHFFSPVHKMALVEIIKGKNTGDEAVAKALDYVTQIKKTPIVVNDARFFYANRCILPYVNEGIRMVAEGVAPALIENAAKQMGMPVGPLQLTDEISIDLAVKIAKASKAAMGDAYPETPADDIVFKMAADGRLGRKSKSGFYAYDDKGRRTGLWGGLAENWPVSNDQPDVTEVQHRLIMSQVLEAIGALDEEVLLDIREGDVAAILGWGFMPWTGGPFSWLDIIGAPRAVEICDTLTAAHGERFAAPKSLRGLAATGKGYYNRFGAAADAA